MISTDFEKFVRENFYREFEPNWSDASIKPYLGLSSGFYNSDSRYCYRFFTFKMRFNATCFKVSEFEFYGTNMANLRNSKI